MFYRYSIKYYDSDSLNLETSSGIVCANSYSEAVSRILQYYGEHETEELTVKFIYDFTVLKMPEGILDSIEEMNEIV